MRQKSLLYLVTIPLVSAAVTLAGRTAWERWIKRSPVLECTQTINLGERDLGEIAVGHFQLTNRGQRDLILEHFQTSCSCAGVEHEAEGKFARVESVRLSPGQQAELVARVAVGARPGQSQSVQILFRTNDPTRPIGSIEVIVPRVKGTVYTEPCAVIFGSLPVQRRARQVIDVYDNGVSGRRIDQVRSTHPERFGVRLLPLQKEELQRRHQIAGKLIARLEVTARTEHPGQLDGLIEIGVANETRGPALVPIAGKVVRSVEIQPNILVLPRRVEKRFLYSGQVFLWSRDGTPISVEVISVPPGMSVRVGQVAEREDQRSLEVEYRPPQDGKNQGLSEARVPIRAHCGAEEVTFEIPILISGKPS